MLRIESIVNFRDVGGHATADGRRMREGVVYRSGHLAAISREDAAALEALPIRTVIDFRTNVDVSEDGGSGRLENARRVNLPMGDPASGGEIRELFSASDGAALERHLGDGQAEAIMIAAAEGLVLSEQEGFAGMLRVLAEPDATPALVHCSAGKDRTGWASSLLLLIAGVPEETVIAHYTESNRRRAAENADVLGRLREGVDPEWIRPFLECRTVYAHASLRVLRERWGDVESYAVEGLGLSRAELGRVREILLG